MKNAEPRPVHIEPLDRLLQGGVAARSVHMIAGCTGSGRTTLATMIAAEGARAAYFDSLRGQPLRRWVYGVSDGSQLEIAVQAVAYLAEVPYDFVAEKLDDTPEEKRDHLARSYFERPADAGPLERFAAAFQCVTKGLAVLSLRQRTREWGPLIAFASEVDRLAPISGLTLDDVISPTEDYMRLIGRYEPHYFVRNALKNLRTYVATHHDVPVWALLHLAGKLGAAPAHEWFHHSQTAECRSAWQEVETCLLLGNRDSTGKFRIACTLRRGEASREAFVARFATGSRIIEAVGEGISIPSRSKPIPQISLAPEVAAKLREDRAERRRWRQPARQIDIGAADN